MMMDFYEKILFVEMGEFCLFMWMNFVGLMMEVMMGGVSGFFVIYVC